jgi:signal transduction histidine kinase
LQEAAKSKKISITCNIEPELSVFVDENQLQFIIRNLLANAIKFTHLQGSIHISAIKEDREVSLSISDTGVGMTEQQIANLLGGGKHKSTLGTNGEKGTGLGLLFSQEFIQKNNGRLTITSKVNEGTTFVLTLPAAYQNANPNLIMT